MDKNPSLIDLDFFNRAKVVRRYTLRATILLGFAYVVYRKDLSIDLQLNSAQSFFGTLMTNDQTEVSLEGAARKHMPAANVSLLQESELLPPAADAHLGNTYSNLSYTDDRFATKDDTAAREAKRRKQIGYVRRFAQTAKEEMEKYGIPASIILAQGLLESDAGESKLAVRNRNHFGIKCFSRTCRKGHCSNYTDDSHKDFFRIYKSDWESYRAHSQLLQADRYRHLYALGKKDYRGWARGLKKAGYATDPYYAEKLIETIEDLKLYDYDR